MTWTPEDEPRLRQEAIERAEAAERGGYRPVLSEAELALFINSAAPFIERALAEIVLQHRAIIELLRRSQPPTKDQPQEPKE